MTAFTSTAALPSALPGLPAPVTDRTEILLGPWLRALAQRARGFGAFGSLPPLANLNSKFRVWGEVWIPHSPEHLCARHPAAGKEAEAAQGPAPGGAPQGTTQAVGAEVGERFSKQNRGAASSKPTTRSMEPAMKAGEGTRRCSSVHRGQPTRR